MRHVFSVQGIQSGELAWQPQGLGCMNSAILRAATPYLLREQHFGFLDFSDVLMLMFLHVCFTCVVMHASSQLKASLHISVQKASKGWGIAYYQFYMCGLSPVGLFLYLN